MIEKTDLQIRLLRVLLMLMAGVAVVSVGVHLGIQSRLDALPATAAPSMYALLSLQTWLQAALVGGLLVLVGYFVLLPVARQIEQSRKEVEEKEAALEHARQHDSLTGFLDRHSFEQLLEHTGAVAERHNHAVGLLRLRIGGLPSARSRQDYAAADARVSTVASRLADMIRAADRPARLGEEEFAILIPRIKSVDGLGRLAERLVEDLKDTLGEGREDREQSVTVAVGVAVAWPSEGAATADLLDRTAEAVEEAERAGTSGWRYHPSAVQGMTDRLSATG